MKARTTSPSETLFNKYHRRILALLLLRPDRNLYVREIARLTKVPAGSLHRELKHLSESGLLTREPAGNHVRYRANRASPIFEELAGIFRKTTGYVDVLRDALEQFPGRIDVAFIFGSVAQAKEQDTSDVDLFVVGRVDFVSVVRALTKIHQRLGREINPVVMERLDLRTKLQERDRFIQRIMREPRLFVIGDEDDLGKLTKDRPVKTTHHRRKGSRQALRGGTAKY